MCFFTLLPLDNPWGISAGAVITATTTTTVTTATTSNTTMTVDSAAVFQIARNTVSKRMSFAPRFSVTGYELCKEQANSLSYFYFI